jgi:hypothetical protein
MSQVETTDTGQDGPAEKIAIKVNDDSVAVTDKHQTGAGIKAAAIAQGVPIEADFDLSEVLPNDKQKPIADDKKVEVKDGDEFWAIPGDDNS